MRIPIQQAFRGTGSIVSACIVLGALISAGVVLREVVLYPRTDDAEVTANFIGIAPVVEGPVVKLPIHDNDFVKKGDLLYKIDDRPYLYTLQNALAAQAELEGEIENESRRISSQVNSVDVANAGEQSALANETRAADEIEIAEAAIARSEAALKQAQADESYAVGNFHRVEPLLAKGFVTEDGVHKARTTADAKTAAVEQAKSQLQLAKASLLAASAQKQQACDAVLGVVLGIVAMWLVFDHLWARTSSGSVRSLLLGTLRNITNLNVVSATTPQEANQQLAVESSRINMDFDKLRDLADLYAFESFPKKPQESLVNRSIVTLLPELRAFLLVKTGLLQHENLMAASEGDELIQEVKKYASSVLQGLAHAIEHEAPEQLSSSYVHTEELRERVQSEDEKSERMKDPQKHTEMRLCASLLEIASHLEWRARLNFVVETAGAEAAGNWPIVKTEATIPRAD